MPPRGASLLLLLVLGLAGAGCPAPRVRIVAPVLDMSEVRPGATVRAEVLFTNEGTADSVGAWLLIEAVPPGSEPQAGYEPQRRYFQPVQRGDGSFVMPVGASYRLSATFSPLASDPTGRWRACPLFVEIHDAVYRTVGPCVPFSVLRAQP